MNASQSREPVSKKIGGWLAVFLYGRAFYLLFDMVSLKTSIPKVFEVWNGAAGIPLYRVAVTMSVLGTVLKVGGSMIGYDCVSRRAKGTIVYWQLFLGAMALYLCVTVMVWKALESIALSRQLLPTEMITSGVAEVVKLSLTELLSSLVWMWYWGRSSRVRETFPEAESLRDFSTRLREISILGRKVA